MTNLKTIVLSVLIVLGSIMQASADEFPVWEERPMDFYFDEEEGLEIIDLTEWAHEGDDIAKEMDLSWNVATSAAIKEQSGEYKQTRPNARSGTPTECAPLTSIRPQSRPTAPYTVTPSVDDLIASL